MLVLTHNWKWNALQNGWAAGGRVIVIIIGSHLPLYRISQQSTKLWSDIWSPDKILQLQYTTCTYCMLPCFTIGICRAKVIRKTSWNWLYKPILRYDIKAWKTLFRVLLWAMSHHINKQLSAKVREVSVILLERAVGSPSFKGDSGLPVNSRCLR